LAAQQRKISIDISFQERREKNFKKVDTDVENAGVASKIISITS
jgi:hypothetical protein